jgi:hypothetical protein
LAERERGIDTLKLDFVSCVYGWREKRWQEEMDGSAKYMWIERGRGSGLCEKEVAVVGVCD